MIKQLPHKSYSVFKKLGTPCTINGVTCNLINVSIGDYTTNTNLSDQALSFKLHVFDYLKLNLNSVSELRNMVIDLTERSLYGCKLKIIAATVANKDIVLIKAKPHG